jgi:hypothetical protein
MTCRDEMACAFLKMCVGVEMRRVIAYQPFTATGEATVLSVEVLSHMVYLRVHGQVSLEISSRCDTCPFAFTKLLDAASVDLHGVIDRLHGGISTIGDDIIDFLVRGLPAGEYLATLLELEPTWTFFGQPDDYFSTEQGGIWAPELQSEGGRHFPRTDYYRTATTLVKPDAKFFEFVVPLHHPGSPQRVYDWKQRMQEGARPVALAVAFGEKRQPATWDGNPSVTTHLCVAHYLLDGHHRFAAAADAGIPIRLLSAYALGGSVLPPWRPNEAVTATFLRREVP